MSEGNPQTIGKYEVLGPLGRGSMGVVYRARDPEIGREVAIKTLRKVGAASFHSMDQALQRFRVEARSAGNLRHPNIITIFEVNRQDDMPYLVMDYVQGESLDSLIKSSDRLTPEMSINYLRQAAQALDYAHEKGVVHRDIKPSNMLIDRRGTLYVLDFGIATISGSLAESEDPATKSLVMGTPGYMSPEQILNQDIDSRSDIFSLAILAFECFTGKRPFPGDNFTSVVSNILDNPPLSLTALAPHLPLALEREFDKALSKRPEDRYQKAEVMVEALARACGIDTRIIAGSVVAAKRKSAGRKRKGGSEWQAFQPDEILADPSQGTIEEEPPEEQEDTHVSAVVDTADVKMAAVNTEDGQRVLRTRTASRDRLFLGAGAALMMALGLVLLWYASSGTLLVTTVKTPAIPVNPLAEAVAIPPEAINLLGGAMMLAKTDEELASLSTETTQALELSAALRELLRRGSPRSSSFAIRLSQSNSAVLRISALRALVELKQIQPVVSLLADSDPLVRSYAARAVMAVGSTREILPLKIAWLQEDVTDVRDLLGSAIKLLAKKSV